MLCFDTVILQNPKYLQKTTFLPLLGLKLAHGWDMEQDVRGNNTYIYHQDKMGFRD